MISASGNGRLRSLDQSLPLKTTKKHGQNKENISMKASDHKWDGEA